MSTSDIGDSTAPATIRRATWKRARPRARPSRMASASCFRPTPLYGIGVDAFSAEAVQRLLDAKNRGRDMPPPVLIGEPASDPDSCSRRAPEQPNALVEQTLARRTDGDLPDPTQSANGSW